ncbi:hypothetical protein SAMN05421781_0808 [Marinococcus luteus]|uniref:Uncharacterized protein n=1 Tax=Marinococcus luteus TaxID=1122204 RepID=A0A1H2RKI1_9BACI|nr:hypothetical protein [Marinococcus luteus]SDW19680.1 hypothetical protein SAMN05421781_0808 [Marinococcus luteus]
MREAFKHTVSMEMMQAANGRLPANTESLIEAAHRSNEIAVLLPFYMYCFDARGWQEYTLFAEDSLPAVLNHAAYIALGAPALHADKKLKRYFYGAAAITPLPEDRQTAEDMKTWACRIFRQYQLLRQRTRPGDLRPSVRDRHANAWVAKTWKREASNGYYGREKYE